jgi:hypothetical protein
MSYPQQPGNWSDPSWPSQPGQPPQPGYDPKSPYGDPAAPTSGPQASPPGYPAGGYAAGYPGYGYPVAAAPPTNGLAIAALVCSIAGVATCITAPVGAILGHVARRQIRERGESGDGMALAGIIVGWIITALMLLLIAFYIVVIVLAINADSNSDFYLNVLTARVE